jgi:DNA-binding NarL/FixJ family response regulator
MKRQAPRIAEFAISGERLSVVAADGEGNAQADELARFRIGDLTYAVIRQQKLDASEQAEPNAADVLTGRELQIAAMVAHGHLNKEIAAELRISEWTVCAHLRRIYCKLRVPSRAAMVYRCASLVAITG